MQNTASHRIGLQGFAASDALALRSVIGLLKPYLKTAWQVVDDDLADLVLVHAIEDGQADPRCDEIQRFACVVHPRKYPGKALHRPFRSSEILALLSEFQQNPTASLQPAASAPAIVPGGVEAPGPVYALLRWPAGLAQWSAEWRRLAACLGRHPSSLERLCAMTNVAPDEARRFLAAGHAGGYIEIRPGEATTPAGPAQGTAGQATETASSGLQRQEHWFGGLIGRLRKRMAGVPQ